MKTALLFGFVIAVSSIPAAGQGAAGAIIKQRAKEVRDQSNVRQGVPAPTQPHPAAFPPAPGPGQMAPNPRAQNIARLQADLAAMTSKTATPAVRQRFTRNLLAAASGRQPDHATVGQFVDSLVPVLTGVTLEAKERARLAQNLNAAFDAANTAPARLDAVYADVQAILQVGGARRSDAVAVVDNLKAVVADIQKAPTR
ncbi:MAG TPA: hypothetical protein PLT00_09810 [Verrucomicrobiota bacterium]|jgi:hypothetical protein|nr:MAG: hypothetical protein BWX84_00308 [Verrucomicrobia bacterium ADurb.Bin118]HPY30315.1 hypothetical protein [Verrucomicrobiota bacterium]HQB16992.1 hypothetical protein [Verrucomicrobiota bacterium]